MPDALLLDVVLVLALVLYAAGMWRAGIVAGALAIAGLLGGGLLALWGLPLVLDRWQPAGGEPTVRVLVVIIGSFLSAVIGQQVGAALGARWRSRLRNRPARLVDSLLGAVGAVVVGAGFAGTQYSILPLLWVLLGGAGTLLGPLVGTLLMFYLVDLASGVTDAYMLVVGVVLLLLVLFAPQGLLGVVRDRWLPWLP